MFSFEHEKGRKTADELTETNFACHFSIYMIYQNSLIMTHAQALESFILYISCYKINLPLAHKSKSFAKGRREDEKITKIITRI